VSPSGRTPYDRAQPSSVRDGLGSKGTFVIRLSSPANRDSVLAFGWIPMPKRVAERFFVPDYRLVGRDVTLERVRAVRSWLGLGVLVWIAITYGGTGNAAQGWMVSFAASVLVAIIACPIAVGIMIALTRPESRAETRRSLMLPLRSLGLFVLVSAATLGGLSALAYGSKGVTGKGDPLSIALTAVGLGVVWWVLRFWFLAVRAIPQHLFRAVDGHPLLPPVIAPWLAWTGALIDLGDDGAKGSLPTSVRLIGSLGGPVTITVMSLWEARRVRSRYGVTFRGGPHPTRMPDPVPQPMPSPPPMYFPNQPGPHQQNPYQQTPHQQNPYGRNPYGQAQPGPYPPARPGPYGQQPPPPQWGPPRR
jgi:hypothetical protein